MNKDLNSYRSMDVMTAKKTKLILMMYDGAIRFAEEGLKRMKENDIEGRGIYLGKTQRIILELRNVLDYETGGEIATNLARLYTYVNRHLTMANIRGEEKLVEDCLNVLRELRKGWDEVLSKPVPENVMAGGNMGMAGSHSAGQITIQA